MKALIHLPDKAALRISLIYIAFAGAWILLSDRLLQLMLTDAAAITELQTYKGATFVLLTGMLLYQLISRQSPRGISPAQIRSYDRTFPWKVFVMLGLAIGASGWFAFTAMRDSIRHEAQRALAANGELKAKQIESWLQERINDLVFDATDSQTSRVLSEWMRTGKGAENLPDILKRFEVFKQIHHYNSVEAYDLQDNPRFGNTDASSLEHGAAARNVIARGEPQLVDFHHDPNSSRISLGIMVPLMVGGKVGGALYAALDPAYFLYPLMQDWSSSSKTGETLLFRRSGKNVLYLNESRHRKNTALAFIQPLSDHTQAAAQAFAGKRGMLENVNDYRKQPVLGYVAEITGTPWLMLVKVDEAEAYAAVNRLGLFSALATLLLISLSGYGVWLWWQRQQEHFAALQKQEVLERQALETSYDALSKYANDIILITDETGILMQVNNRALEIYGYSREELIGQPCSRLSPARAHAGFEQEHDRVMRTTSHRYETLHQCKDGSVFPVEVSARLIEQQGRRFIHMVLQDITERKIAEESKHLASLVYQNSSEAMMVTDGDGVIISINPAFTELTGYLPEDALGKTTKILNSGRQDEAFFREMWNSLNTTGHWHGEIWNRRKNGEVFPEWLSINSIFNEDGSVHRRVALFSDITQKKESEALIWHQANFDQLTGLPNRRMFHDRLEQEMKKAHRAGLPMALLFLDLDRFKEVNDTLGHDMGDLLLKEAALRLSSCVRESDTVARLGGDEFTVLLGELEDASSVERVSQCILHKLAEPFQLGLDTAYVSASIGITLYPEDAGEVEALLKNADQAMYAAKHHGRNRFNYFTPAMQEAAQARMRLATDLRSALAESQFRIYYQPIVELATGVIHKAEALIRWQHPKLGLIGPAEFITIAEETGMILDIGDWVFHEAVDQVERWRASHHVGFQISVNKSPVQFHDENKSHADWFDHLQKLGLPGQSIVVEITEGLLLDASSVVTDKLLAFRDAGIQVSLDDFGTGYSSLSYLKKFDIDYLKIDQSFVRNLEPHSDDMALCEAIIVMAHKLGIQVIAEGIETVKQRALLTAAKCDYGQGYLFSRPLPADEFEKLLKVKPGSQ
ncbi:MAG TPA: EAL domain-containing protein [Novimethylophilus sp.]|uniref:bifunctional diguanylate cyclase/phosphodiesterase n=1 Tax=Novimethylophilus sp. TaxID=2137426 RepID=UPI002F4140A9